MLLACQAIVAEAAVQKHSTACPVRDLLEPGEHYADAKSYRAEQSREGLNQEVHTAADRFCAQYAEYAEFVAYFETT